ncbi:hypothetical protein Ctob_012785 [Chrysochromulina tobinii]|uniref:Uncharacterized protein n=1 Tax=Chrysochromulina tobinii TaxID=1460289 RepID=A0A0M0JM10_9EUKA|nr:hypothetical protein Ctob_012785 [Chrysochromulina tobinii]|eukprot:KOO27367.1 hypothetical protein Ctob_012785 [Chrysochromulina sp. CCMP291]
MPQSEMPFCLATSASILAYSASSLLPRRLMLVSPPVTATMAATDFAPTGPMLLKTMLSDASLVSLLLWMALQTALTPSSLRRLEDKFRAVSPPLTRRASAIAVIPSAV